MKNTIPSELEIRNAARNMQGGFKRMGEAEEAAWVIQRFKLNQAAIAVFRYAKKPVLTGMTAFKNLVGSAFNHERVYQERSSSKSEALLQRQVRYVLRGHSKLRFEAEQVRDVCGKRPDFTTITKTGSGTTVLLELKKGKITARDVGQAAEYKLSTPGAAVILLGFDVDNNRIPVLAANNGISIVDLGTMQCVGSNRDGEMFTAGVPKGTCF